MATDMIVFGEDFGSHPSSTQHLIKILSEDRKILWVNSIGLRSPRLNSSDVVRVVRKVKAALRPKEHANQSRQVSKAPPFPVVQPIVWPMATNNLLRRLNKFLIKRKLSASINDFGIRKPVLWMSLPSAVDAIGSLDEYAVVYYCGDDFGSLSGVDHKAALDFEKDLSEKADLIITASQALAEKFPPEKTHVITHGVDFELFSTTTPRAQDLPTGPVAGFYGGLAAWIDKDLIVYAARELPEWQFVLIGPIQSDVSVFEGISNIRLLGNRPHSELAAYSQHWDVGMIPFLDTPQIRACNPLKLREYLAAGQPIVSTPFPAVEPYANVVRIAYDRKSFVENLKAALTDKNSKKMRQKSVSSESWSARAAEVAKLIEDIKK